MKDEIEYTDEYLETLYHKGGKPNPGTPADKRLHENQKGGKGGFAGGVRQDQMPGNPKTPTPKQPKK